MIRKILSLKPRNRGAHVITSEILQQIPELQQIEVGLLHIFIQHTSASLTINENADPDVLRDLELGLNHIAPESLPFHHTAEGPDDMPAHIKASLMGSFLLIPIQNGKLALGTWQGIYLCEHRNQGGSRNIVLTITQ